jgi:hypothetical protein
MSQTLSAILTASVLALTAGMVYPMTTRARTRRLASAVALGLALAVATLIVPAPVATRGGEDVASVVLCYACMLLGMMAEYGYLRAERGDVTFTFELMPFLMPIFASPIVFIPLLSLMTEDAMTGGAFTRAKLMVYLVAFQNGFFWKSFFEQRRIAPKPVASTVSAA